LLFESSLLGGFDTQVLFLVISVISISVVDKYKGLLQFGYSVEEGLVDVT
jgi:hypothetical protein